MSEKEFNANVQGFSLSVVTPEIAVKNNVDQLVVFIENRVKDYDPAKYGGNADAAKKDRAELNKGAEQVKSIRQQIQTLNPYGEVIEKLAGAEKLIKSGSDALAVIVKAREDEEKEAKRKLINTEWESLNFNLFTIDRIFNQKWLNKTYKMADIQKELSSAVEKAYADIKTIESLSGDVEMLKAHYLISLDLSETMRYADEIERKKKLAEEEAAARAEREHCQKVEAQKVAVSEEQKDFAKKSAMSGMVAEALEDEVPAPEVKEYTITVKVTESSLLGIKNYLNGLGVEYECNELVF